MQFVDFQSIVQYGFKNLLKNGETERLTSNINKKASNEILKHGIRFQTTFNSLKKMDHAILTIFLSTYACKSLFSEMNNIKDSLREFLADDSNLARIPLE
ncbi:dimer_Tnp_hAT domain-containing protein [Trichonephila clavipes]|nr:dimer_Tnp_hAT domain-containing protein [Trichonephila clavipes]